MKFIEWQFPQLYLYPEALHKSVKYQHMQLCELIYLISISIIAKLINHVLVVDYQNGDNGVSSDR